MSAPISNKTKKIVQETIKNIIKPGIPTDNPIHPIKFQRPPAGVQSRTIINILNQRGRLTRNQIYTLTSRDVFSSKVRLTKILRFLIAQKRVKV